MKLTTILCRKSTDIHALKQDTKILMRNFNTQPEELTINRVIPLSEDEFNDFKENLLDNREWLKDTGGEILLVLEQGSEPEKGIIVQTSGFEYARYAGLPIQETDYKKCPRCGKLYTEHPAISRKDNKTEICSRCGTEEALEQAGFDYKFIQLLDNLHNIANEYNVEIEVKKPSNGKKQKFTIKPE